MQTRSTTFLPDERFAALQSALEQRVASMCDSIAPAHFCEFLDPLMRMVFTQGIRRVGAHEGTIWLLDDEHENLVAALNSGPCADTFVGQFKQPLSSGMISMVCASEQPVCENEVYQSQLHDKTLDRTLRVLTCAMIAVPLYFARQLQGVVSAVILKPADDAVPDPPGFSAENLREVQLMTDVLTRLIDHRLLAMAVGWESR